VNNVEIKFTRQYTRIIIYLITLTLIWYFFPPIYFKSDDVIMSMIAGGYGQMHEKSILLHHSSVVMGFIGSKLPIILGITPYNYVNLGILTFNFIVLSELLNKFNTKFLLNFLVGLSSSLFILIRPTFTTIAGYLSIVGMISIYYYSTNLNKKYLIYGLSLFLIASFIRDEMVIFFIIFASAVLFQCFLKSKKDFIVIGLIFVIIFGLFQFINRFQYSGESFEEFRKFASVGHQILDYNADRHILQNSKILFSNDYSSNDINLIRNWFFVDTHLSNPTRLDDLLIDTRWKGPISNFDLKQSILSTSNLITSYPLNLILISALILMIFSNRSLVLMFLWLSLVLALFAGALIGRQLDYVYFPLLSFLFVMIYLNLNQSIFITKFLIYCLTILVVLTTLSANKSNKELIEKSILAYSNINLDKLWVIGGGLPTNIIFPLLTRPNQQTELITSDWSIYSPKSNFIKYNSNNNFLSELHSQQGVNVATNIYHIPLIQLYCKEKFGSDLIIKPVMNDNLIKINNLRCLGDQPRIVTPNLEFEKSGEGFLWITPDQFEFNLLNYSSTYFNESYNLVSQNNPCKKDISYTLSSSMFSITASTLQKDISIPLSLKPYEKILITISIPSGQEFCKIADDERSLVVMFKNFT